MPKMHVSAGATVPAIHRRTILSGIAALATGAGLHRAIAAPPAPEDLPALPRAPVATSAGDPVLDLVNRFRVGILAYDEQAGDSDDAACHRLAAVTFRPPMAEIEAWEGPATTRAGAMAALRLVNDDLRDCGSSDMVRPLVAAATAYFDTELRP
ncbi:hypothetical protein [Mesorhizobium sp. Cs1321R2N1]|uniref:hypothetical protein n=1 Tax=Mesorhizobium sp. Cs1321R2N1 TaxID=3015174 RepID=UPI00301E189A